MSPEWLLNDGQVVPAVIVLSHEEQLERLRAACPEAVPAAVVAGDVCFDRMLASAPLRWTYRNAFGVSPSQRLILVSSTWGRESLAGRRLELVRRLAESLPVDEFRVVVALHPAIWHSHSPWQVRAWLADCSRAGVVVLPAEEGWRAAVVAADLTIGDHGSVPFYAAALGCPLLLATRPDDEVDPASAVGGLLANAPTLDPDGEMYGQIRQAIDHHRPGDLAAITALATSLPGEAGHVLQAVLYRWLRLPGPFADADPITLPVPQVPASPTGAHFVSIQLHQASDQTTVTVVRYPVGAFLHDYQGRQDGHLVVDTGQSRRRWLQLAEVMVDESPRDAMGWAAAALSALPGCLLATAPLGDGMWLVATRDGRFVRFDSVPDGIGRVCASVVHGWLAARNDLDTLQGRVCIDIGGQRHTVQVSRLWRDDRSGGEAARRER